MDFFETNIVKTWKPSVLLRAFAIILLIGGATILYVFDVEDGWFKTSAGIAYFLGMSAALSLTYIKPKNLGGVEIDKSEIRITLKNSKKVLPLSEIKEIGFNYRGYASFWKYTYYGNKNYIYFTTISGEKFNYEIILQNKQKKEEFKNFLDDLDVDSSIRIQKFGNFSL